MATIFERLAATIESLAELRVVTAVGNVTVSVTIDAATKDVAALPDAGVQQVPALFTEMNLLTGDITTLIHADFKGKDDSIAAFHQAQVANGQKIVSTNVQTIVTLAQSAGKQLSELLDQPSRREPAAGE